MRFRDLALIVVLALAPVAARADPLVIPDPDKWMDGALQDLTQGRSDEFARNFLKLIDKPTLFDSFAGNLKVLSRIGPADFFEKVLDRRYGTSLREVIYVALYQKTDYFYYKFTIKKNHGGWLISNFEFKSEPAHVFPKDFGNPF